MNEWSSGDGPDLGESSHRAGDGERLKNVWENSKGDHRPRRKSWEHPRPLSSGVKQRKVLSRSNEMIDVHEAVRMRGYPEHPTSPGAAARIILQGHREDTSPVPKKKAKKNIPDFSPLLLTATRDDDELDVRDPEYAERTKGVKLLKKKAWAVTADAIRDEKGAFIIFAVRDLVIYLLFLSLLLIIAYGSKDNAFNYYGLVLSDLITKSNFETTIGYGRDSPTVSQTFSGLRSIRQLWDFIHQILFKVIYMDPIKNRILMENVFMGTPSIRQVRVKKDTCTTASLFQDLYETCYGKYTEENEDKEPFGRGIAPPWVYSPGFPEDEVHGIQGDYKTGGYVFNFSMDANFSKYWLEELESNNWIGRGTRAIIIDLVLYTANTNLFLVVKLLAEMLPEGGVRTSQTFTTIKFMRYVTPFDLFVMSCEFTFFLFTIYFTLEELQQIWILRRQYLSNWWNILDIMIIGLSFSMIFTSIRRFIITRNNIGNKIFQSGTSNHVSFDDILEANGTYMYILSFLLFLAWLKLLKFASLTRSVVVLATSIDQVKWELLTVTATLFIVLAGISIFGFIGFGDHVEQFQDITNSFFSVASMFVGRLYYVEELIYAQPRLTYLFITVYNLIVVVIFLNTYIALVVYGYHQTHLAHDEGVMTDQQYMGDLVYGFFITALTFLGRYKLVKKYRMRDVRIRNKADYDALVTMLRRYGWEKKELHLFLKSYRLYRGEDISINELAEIYNDFWIRQQLFIEVEAHNEIRKNLEKIEKTIEFCEHAIVDIMSKTDVLADKAAKKLFLSPTQQN